MREQVRTLKTGEIECRANQDLIEYGENTVMIVYEFNVYNLSNVNIEIRLNQSGDVLVLEPEEGFVTNMPITHAEVLTAGAVVKYSYWI